MSNKTEARIQDNTYEPEEQIASLSQRAYGFFWPMSSVLAASISVFSHLVSSNQTEEKPKEGPEVKSVSNGSPSDGGRSNQQTPPSTCT